MKTISICDRTVKQLSTTQEYSLTFREKIEVAKLLDKLGVDVIELNAITQAKVDSLLIKSIVTAVKNSCIAVPVVPGKSAVETVSALKETKNYRLQVEAPMSSVQMEYIYHAKPAKLKEMIITTVESCLEYTDNVEFVALDATRADEDFMYDILQEVLRMGIKRITICDDAGNILPKEFSAFLEKVTDKVPDLKESGFGVACADNLNMADACSIEAINIGANEVKAAAFAINVANLNNVAKVIKTKENELDATTCVATNRMKQVVATIKRMCVRDESEKNVLEVVGNEEVLKGMLSGHDSKEAILQVAVKLGYDLSEEDANKVYEDFLVIADKKEQVSVKELDAIIATSAMQVPQTYKLESYIANSGLSITSMVHLKLNVNGEIKEGISLGDGPVDAALLAIEQITGRHFPLDDFRISSITEGKEATGEALLKLENNGKLYPGRGLSTDIVAASIKAYVNALNKIVYEEEE